MRHLAHYRLLFVRSPVTHKLFQSELFVQTELCAVRKSEAEMYAANNIHLQIWRVVFLAKYKVVCESCAHFKIKKGYNCLKL